jgi:hypothetical protein
MQTLGLMKDDTDYKKKIAYALMMQGMSGEPVQHWAQGLARMAQGLVGGREVYNLDQERLGTEKAGTDFLAKMLAAQQGAPAAPASAPQMPAMPPQSPVSPAPRPAFAAAPMGAVQQPPQPAPDPNKLPVMNLTDPRVTVLGESIEPLPPAPRPGPAAGSGADSMPPVQAALGAPAASHAMPQNDMRSQIVAALNSPDPKIRRAAAPFATLMYQQQLAGNKPTDDITEYEKARSQGYKGTFVDFQKEIKGAGRTQVTIDQRNENEFEKESGKIQAKRFGDLVEEGATSRQMQSDVAMLRDLGEKIRTGKGAEIRAVIGPWAQALGIPGVEGLGEIQAFEAIVNRVAPTMRVKGTGAQSDFELRNFFKQFPSIGNTPEGNAIIDKTMQGFVQNKIAASEIASKAVNKEISRTEAEKMIRSLPDPMKEWREFQKTIKAAPSQPSIDDLIKKYAK